MKMRYIDRPVPIPLEHYNEAVGRISGKLSRVDGVIGIYRFGNITTPGISDIDLLVVFEDHASSSLTGFEGFSESLKGVFTHGIMALKESHFVINNYYMLWSRHALVAGKETPLNPMLKRDSEADRALHQQTAIEFLAANYIDLKVQVAYGTIKLRSMLQHMKGIAYDLEYLGINDSPLHPLLDELKEWMASWFRRTPSDSRIDAWLGKWIPLYDQFTEQLMKQIPLYLPDATYYNIAGNLRVYKNNQLHTRRRGLLLSPDFAVIGRKYFNLQNKLNRFQFGMPLTSYPSHPILKERFIYLTEMKSYNRMHLPGFMTMTTSITAKLI